MHTLDKQQLFTALWVSGIFMFGMLCGILIFYYLALEGIKVIGTSFQVQSMNVTVQLNQSMLLEAMQDAINRSSTNIDLADGLIK